MMAIQTGIVSEAETHPDHAAYENKGACNGNEDIQSHIGFCGKALFLHELTAAVDDQHQCYVAEKADPNHHMGRRTEGGVQEQDKQVDGDNDHKEHDPQYLPPSAAAGREEDALFPGGGFGLSVPAVIGGQFHDGIDAQQQPDENSRQGEGLRQKVPDGVGAELEPDLETGADQERPVTPDSALLHGGPDVFHLDHRVRLNRGGVLGRIAEDLHLVAAGHQFPAGGLAKFPELLLFRRGLRVELTGLGEVHHGVVELRRIAAAVGKEGAAGLFQLPALPGHVLQVAGDAGVVVIGIEIEFPVFLSLHDSISPLRPM